MEQGSIEATRKHELELESTEEWDVSAKRARPAEPVVNGDTIVVQDDVSSAGPAEGGSEAAAPAEEDASTPSAGAETAAPSAAADAPALTSSEAPAAHQENAAGQYTSWNQPEESSSTGAMGAEAPPAPVMAPPPGFGAGGYSGAGYGGPGYGGPGVGGGGGGFGGGAQVCRDFQNGLCHRGARCEGWPARASRCPPHIRTGARPRPTPHLFVSPTLRLELDHPPKTTNYCPFPPARSAPQLPVCARREPRLHRSSPGLQGLHERHVQPRGLV